MTKKEHILQYVTIGISFLAVISSVFSGWMAYNASINSAEVSGKINKFNELETRNYENKSILYNSLIGLADKIESGSGNYQDFKAEIGRNETALEIYGSSTINQLLTCIDNGYNLLSKKNQLVNDYNQENDYQRRIILPALLLKRELRSELNNFDKDLYKFENDGLMRKFEDFLVDVNDLEHLINSCYSGGTSKVIILELKNKSGSGTQILLSPKQSFPAPK